MCWLSSSRQPCSKAMFNASSKCGMTFREWEQCRRTSPTAPGRNVQRCGMPDPLPMAGLWSSHQERMRRGILGWCTQYVPHPVSVGDWVLSTSPTPRSIDHLVVCQNATYSVHLCWVLCSACVLQTPTSQFRFVPSANCGKDRARHGG